MLRGASCLFDSVVVVVSLRTYLLIDLTGHGIYIFGGGQASAQCPKSSDSQ